MRPTSRRLIALAEVVLCSSVPTQFAVAFLLHLMGWAPADGAGRLSFRYIVALSLGDMALLIVLMTAFLRAHGERPAEVWFGHRPVRREVLLGLLMIPAIFLMLIVVLNLLQAVFPALHNVPDNPLEQFARNREQTALFVVVAILAGGVREELQRAFLLDRFERHLGGAIVGAILLSVGFGLGHVVQGWDAVITTALLGAVWAIVYLRRRSTIAPIVSHAGFDALEILRAAFFS